MSNLNICTVCGGMNIRTEKRCFDCGSAWRICSSVGRGQNSLFDRITASPEVLAEKLVYRTIEIAVNRVTYSCWKSTITEDAYRTEAEAIAATVAKLKEVCNEQ